jgi:hypothetical protein
MTTVIAIIKVVQAGMRNIFLKISSIARAAVQGNTALDSFTLSIACPACVLFYQHLAK